MDHTSVPSSVQLHLYNIDRVFEFYRYDNKVTKFLRGKVVVTGTNTYTSSLTTGTRTFTAKVGITVHYGRISRNLYHGDAIVYTNNTALEFHNFSRRLYYNPL